MGSPVRDVQVSLDTAGRLVNTAHMLGQTFDQLVVLYRAANTGGRAQFVCQCSCGKTAVVAGTNLRRGKTKSCGCRRANNLRKIATTHGNSAHPLYARWANMHARCYDPENNRFYRYGARGISVCPRWHDFALYLEDVLPSYKVGLTLDRVDNDGDYTPQNFRWASYKTQGRNRPATIVGKAEIAEMRAMYLSTGCTQRDVGEAFGYCRDTVKHYLRGLRA